MTLRFDPAKVDDAEFVAEIWSAITPDDPQGAESVVNEWERVTIEARPFEHWILSDGDERIGYALRRHAPYDVVRERYGRVEVDIFPAARSEQRLADAYAFVEQRSRDDGTEIFITEARRDDGVLLDFVSRRGYREERAERVWDLDLAAERERLLSMVQESRKRMRELGVDVLTLDRLNGADRYRKLYEATAEAEQDVPSTAPFVPEPFEAFMHWLRAPGLQADRTWVALRDGEPVGLSMLKFPSRGVVRTEWTGVARRARGLGIARALKLETLAQAIDLGVARVRTDNDGENEPILRLNTALGYRYVSEWVELMKVDSGPAGR
jgi:GNAT superfamily N-acetyltransferase